MFRRAPFYCRLHGYGTYQWQDGHSYEGTWKVDNQHGVGRYITVIPTLANRDEITTYEGEFRDGAQLGLARVSIEGGDSVYIGETNNLTYSSTNKSNGESLSEICWGRIEYENGIVYEGECRDFVKEGRGVLMYDRILKGDTMDRFCQLDFTQITSTSKKEELDPHIQELLREVETTHLLIRSLDPIEISTQSSDNIYDILYQRGGMYHGDFLDDDPHGEGSFLLSNGQSYEVRYEHGVLVSVVPQP